MKQVRDIAEALVAIRKNDELMLQLIDELFKIEANSTNKHNIFYAHTLRKALIREWITEEITIN